MTNTTQQTCGCLPPRATCPHPPPFATRSSLVSLFGNSSSRKAVNYSQLAQQASAAYAGLQKGNYSACMPFLKVRGRRWQTQCRRQQPCQQPALPTECILN